MSACIRPEAAADHMEVTRSAPWPATTSLFSKKIYGTSPPEAPVPGLFPSSRPPEGQILASICGTLRAPQQPPPNLGCPLESAGELENLSQCPTTDPADQPHQDLCVDRRGE